MSWLQNTFRGLLFKNVAFNLTIQDKKSTVLDCAFLKDSVKITAAVT